MASSTPGHPLQKDDTTQTTTQWWEWALNEIGTVDGLFVKYLKMGNRPVDPGPQASKPPEPRTAGLLTAYGNRLRTAQIQTINATLPAATAQATIDAIPEPSELDVWEYYGQLLEAFSTKHNEWKISYEIYAVTFPAANVKVFAKTVACLSETSLLLIRGTPQGAAAYDAQDSFGIMKAALDEHSHVAIEVTEEAVSAAKKSFETQIQASETSINAHIEERERLGAHLSKVMNKPLCSVAPSIGSPGVSGIYEDFELKRFLLASLHSTWSEWKRSREMVGTMPAKYADLKLLLRTEESKLILIKASGATPGASFSTEGKLDRTPEKAASTSNFQEIRKCVAVINNRKCGTPFLALQPSFVHCHSCHSKMMNERRSSAKAGGDTSRTSAKPVTRKHGAKRKSHATSGEAEEDGVDNDDDNLIYDNLTAALSRTSLATNAEAVAVDSHATSSHDTDVYFDPCSNSIIIKDAELAVDINDRGPATRISGSVPGGLLVKEHGKVGDLGRAPVHSAFAKNLISESSTIAAGYRVFHDTAVANEYRVTKPGVKPLVFKANRAGTYSMPLEEFRASFPQEEQVIAHSMDAEPEARVFTKSQRERAARYHHDHSHCLGHLHHDRVSRALRSGLLEEPAYTATDVANAQVIYGACPQCAVTKGTRHRATGHYPHQPQRPGERLAGDLFTIMGVLFMLVSCRLIKLRTIQRLTNKSAAQVMLGLNNTVNIWKGYGHQTKVISWDNEPAIVHSAPEIFSTLGVRMEFVSPGSHERVAERDGRTVKEHVYASLRQLPHAVDKRMVEGVARDTVTLLNFFPNSETEDQSARTFVDGERLNYARWSRFAAGDVGEFEIPYTNKSGSRKEIGYVLEHAGDCPRVRLLPSGKEAVIRNAKFTRLAKSPAIIAMIEQGITGAKRQEYNDLLQEMSEFADMVATEGGDHPSQPDEDRGGPPRSLPASLTQLPEPPTVTIPPRLAETEPAGVAFTEPTVPPVEQRSTEAAPGDVPSHSEESAPTAAPAVRSAPPTPTRVAPPAAPTTSQRPVRASAQRPVGFYSDTARRPRAANVTLADDDDEEPPELAESDDEDDAPPATWRPRRSKRTSAKPGESFVDYHCNHMFASECAKLYGEEKQQAAGLNEVINVIGDHEGLRPTDFRTMTDEEIAEALPSFMFYKAKDLLPDEKNQLLRDLAQRAKDAEPENQPWQEVRSKRRIKEDRQKESEMIKIKGRWVGGGNHQDKSVTGDVAPTARAASHAILLAIAALEGRKVSVLDVPSAYLQTEHVSKSGKKVYIVADKRTTELIVRAYPDLITFVRPNGTMMLQVLKALYGLIESALLWYRELIAFFEDLGYTVTETDRAVVTKRVFHKEKCIGSIFCSLHVDDILTVPSNDKVGKSLEQELWTALERKWPGIKLQKGPVLQHLSWEIHQDPATGIITRTQGKAISKMLTTFGVTRKEKRPCRLNLVTRDERSPPLTTAGKNEYVRILATLNFYRDGRADADFVIGHLQRQQAAPTQQDKRDLDHLLAYLHAFPDRPMTYQPRDAQLRAFVDASFTLEDLNSYYGYWHTVGGATIATKGSKIRSVVRSSNEAEGTGVNESASELLWARDLLVELGYGQDSIPIAEDNQSLIQAYQNEPRNFQTKSKHIRLKWKFFRQQRENGLLHLTYCPTDLMRADLLTKPLGGNAAVRHAQAIFDGVLEDSWTVR